MTTNTATSTNEIAHESHTQPLTNADDYDGAPRKTDDDSKWRVNGSDGAINTDKHNGHQSDDNDSDDAKW